MLRCIIVDDEPKAIKLLASYVHAHGGLQLINSTTQPLEALQTIQQQAIDLAFLDINMPGITGLELAKALRGQCKVIFTTGYSQFVSDALDLDVEVVDYLLKPIALPRFIRAVQRAMPPLPAPATPPKGYSLEHDYIFVKVQQQRNLQKIEMAEIDYVEAMRNYMAIHHCGQKTVTLLTMKQMEEALPQKYFVRVQKSFIVALHKIASIKGNTIRLKNSEATITLGNTYKAQLEEALANRPMG
jgi:two-component system, LytTR family, response regulator